MLLFDELVFYMVTQLLLIDIFELAIDMVDKSWAEAEEVLFKVAEDKDRTWGLRFYVLLTECFKEWGLYLKPKNKDDTDSIYRRMYNDLKVKIPFCPLDLYYYTDIEKLAERDAELHKWRAGVANKPSNVFQQRFDTFNDKENVSKLSNATRKQSEVKTATLSKNPTAKKLRSREELSNLVESLKHLDSHRKEPDAKNGTFATVFEQIKQNRKHLMHEIFRHKLVLQRIAQARQAYQDSVILNYDQVEEFLKINDKSLKDTQDCLLKELELANWLFEYIDTKFNADPRSRYLQLRKEISRALERIYGVHPRYDDQFLDTPAQVYDTVEEYEQAGNPPSDRKYRNRDHSIQVDRHNVSSFNRETSIAKGADMTYSFSKEVNDNQTTIKGSRQGNNDFMDEYGCNHNKHDLLSVNQVQPNANVKTFLKNAVEREKALIRGSGNRAKMNSNPSPYDEFLSNIKKVPVKITSTLKDYEDTGELKPDTNASGSRVRDMIRLRSRRGSRDSKLNDSKGSVKINYDNLKSRPSGNLINDSKLTKVVGYRDEYGRDSSNKKLTSNAKNLDTSSQRTSQLNIRSYSQEDTLLSLKKKNPRISSSIFNKNGLSVKRMDDLLIKKQMNSLETENNTLQARKKRLEQEVSELSMRGRSIGETPVQPVRKTRGTLGTVTDFGNTAKPAENKPGGRKVPLNCMVEEFNRKNEMYTSLKLRYNQLHKGYEEKVKDSYYLNLKKGDKMKDTVMAECTALLGSTRTQSMGLGTRNQGSGQFINFEFN